MPRRAVDVDEFHSLGNDQARVRFGLKEVPPQRCFVLYRGTLHSI
jgi:hypothetical protein